MQKGCILKWLVCSMNQPAVFAAPAFPAAQSSLTFLLAGPAACPRCNGTGYLSQFRHVEQGRCFRCQGSGRVGR